MAEPGNAVRAILVADATISGKVGSRVHPLFVGQSPTYPLIGYQLISEIRFPTFDGPDDEYIQTDFQIDAYDDQKDFSGARSLATNINDALDGYKDTTIAGVEVLYISFLSRMEYYEPELEIYRVQQDFRVIWKAA